MLLKIGYYTSRENFTLLLILEDKFLKKPTRTPLTTLGIPQDVCLSQENLLLLKYKEKSIKFYQKLSCLSKGKGTKNQAP